MRKAILIIPIRRKTCRPSQGRASLWEEVSMTFWAKLLTVVVFILALIFAAMSAVVFGKREDFRSQLESVKRDYTHDKTVWTQKVDDLTKQRDQAISETG